MSQKTPATMIVNAVGLAAALVVVGWIGYAAFKTDEPAICEGRYPVSTRLSLKNDAGAPVSLSELQARFGVGEWGLNDNAQVIARDDVEPELVVNIASQTGAGFKPDQSRGGVGFIWRPADLDTARPKAACLSYRVFLPKTMQYSGGGTLPGIVIGSEFEPRGDAIVGSGSAARPSWNRDGQIFVTLQYATSEGWKNPIALNSKSQWPVGRWVDVEQEVILNDVGKKNGIIRLWVDGKLAGETKIIGLRADQEIALSGISADVHFGSISNTATAPTDTQIRLSPFVVRWQ